MAFEIGCELDCEDADVFKSILQVYLAVLRKDENNCFYFDSRDGSGGSGGATIVEGVMGGDGSSFQDSGLIGKSQIIVLANGNAIPPGDIDSFDPVTGIIIFDPVLSPGDQIQVIAV